MRFNVPGHTRFLTLTGPMPRAVFAPNGGAQDSPGWSPDEIGTEPWGRGPVVASALQGPATTPIISGRRPRCGPRLRVAPQMANDQGQMTNDQCLHIRPPEENRGNIRAL